MIVVQWFVILAICGLTVALMHLALSRHRKTAQDTTLVALLSPAGPSSSEMMPQPAIDARIAKIISEIPKRRVRHHHTE